MESYLSLCIFSVSFLHFSPKQNRVLVFLGLLRGKILVALDEMVVSQLAFLKLWYICTEKERVTLTDTLVVN